MAAFEGGPYVAGIYINNHELRSLYHYIQQIV
jgi:hypothetical protein